MQSCDEDEVRNHLWCACHALDQFLEALSTYYPLCILRKLSICLIHKEEGKDGLSWELLDFLSDSLGKKARRELLFLEVSILLFCQFTLRLTCKMILSVIQHVGKFLTYFFSLTSYKPT